MLELVEGIGALNRLDGHRAEVTPVQRHVERTLQSQAVVCTQATSGAGLPHWLPNMPLQSITSDAIELRDSCVRYLFT